MKFYKVGGHVRDIIMEVESNDIDWVVVGATEQEMLDMNFSQVGADFPVFLHPVTGEEHALARTERKTAPGYNGFEVQINGVTLEDDLRRRDLTINAMAMDITGEVIDPFGGINDIDDQILRHVDAVAFKEDPVRVLRIARFLARWPSYTVAKETMALCREIVASGEMNHLTPERVWKETEKAFAGQFPSRYFVFLRMIGALEIIFPEIHALIGQTQPYEHHPEGDAFIHTMFVVDNAAAYIHDNTALGVFCALTHDLGKGTSPKETLPHHSGHERRGVAIIDGLCDRLKVSTEFREHAKLVAEYHTHIHNFHILKETTIVKMFDDLNVRKNQHIVEILPDVSYCDSTGRTSFYVFRPYPNAELAKEVFNALGAVKLSNFKDEEEIKKMSVDKIKNFLHHEKVKTVKEIRNADPETCE